MRIFKKILPVLIIAASATCAWAVLSVGQFALAPLSMEAVAHSTSFQSSCDLPPTCTLSASPTNLSGPGNTVLTWDSTNTVGGSIDQGLGSLPGAAGYGTVYVPHTMTFTATFWNSVGDYATCSTTVTVTPPPPPPTCTLSVSPTTLSGPGTVTVYWDSQNATSGSIDNGIGALQGAAGNVSGTVSQTTTFTGTFSNDAGDTVECHATVTVTPPPPPQTGCIEIKKETFDPTGNILTPVAQFTFKLDGGVQTAKNDANGNAIFTNVTPGMHTVTEVPAGSTWKQLSVTPANGTVNVPAGSQCAAVVFKNEQVIPPPPAPTCTFSANPTSITTGGTSKLSWTTANASSISINNGIGSVSANSSKNVSPSASTTYTLTATGAGGTKTCTTTVTVVPPQNGCIEIKKETFDTADVAITPVAQFTFKLDGGVQTATNDANGDAIFNNVTPGNHTVTEVSAGSTWSLLSVTPANGAVTVQSGSVCSAVVFKNKQVVTQTPTCTLTGSPSSITAGNSATLSWTTSDITAASIDNGVGTTTPVAGGSTSVSPSSTTTYTLSGTGPNGPVTCHTTITVTTPPPPTTPACTLSVSSSSVAPGGSIDISWTSANVTSGSIDNNIGTTTPVDSGIIHNIFPTTTTTYTGTFTGPNGTVQCHATVTVTTPGCTGNCGGGLDQPTVSLFQKPNNQPLAFLSLSQVPYTGFAAGPALTVIFWLAVAALAALIAHLIVGRDSMRHLFAFVVGGFIGVPMHTQGTLANRHALYGHPYPSFDEETHLYDSNHVASVAAPVAPTPAPIAAHPAFTPAPVAPPVPPATTSMRVPATPLPELVDVVESRAHAAGVLMSPEAVTIAAKLAPNRADALVAFGRILDEAVRTIPREDGWIMLTTDRLQEILSRRGITVAVSAAPAPSAVDSTAAVAFTGAILSGDRTTAFAIIRSLEHDNVQPSALMAATASTLDTLYRARHDGHAAPDATLTEKAAHLSDEKLEHLVAVFAHALDHVYASPFTGVKLALAQAFEAIA
ncbi:MAG: hypothetical protein KGI73_03845 [Patescibacteria group bacterium]|nr:hypothetical protein [Patescibacteria group bacterium]